MKILVTGGAGYVGHRLTTRLLNEGHEVTVFDSFLYGVDSSISLIKAGARLIRGDIRDDNAVFSAVLDQDAVFHLAALVGFPVCSRNPTEAYRVIVEGTNCLLDNLVAVGSDFIPVIYASTGSVYGKIEVLCSEDVTPNPQSEYGEYKFIAEQAVQKHGGVGLRFATVFGLSPSMRFDLMPNDFCWKAVRDGYVVLYRGSDRRTFLHIDDAVSAYLSTLSCYEACRGQVYNVGDEKLNLTKHALAKTVQSLHGYRLLCEEVGNDPDFRDYEVSYEKFRTATGFVPGVSLEDGLREVVDFASIVDPIVPWRLPL
jgi:nucleoside-diphosphate-sugar epimerase